MVIDIVVSMKIDIEEFKKQRSWLFIESAKHNYNCDEVEGLINLCDHIADTIADDYGVKEVLFTSEEEE